MNNTFGTHVALTLFGESHGPEIGCVIDGLRPGLRVDEDYIAHRLALRRPGGPGSSARVEKDPFRIVSGVWQGRTTGTPLCILIPNTEARSGDYVNLKNTPRPGHADWTGHVKYQGFNDPRGGGHFSGRLTAALVAAGAIFLAALRERGVRIGTRLARCAGIPDRPFGDLETDLDALEGASFPVLDEARGEAMKAAVLAAAAEGDSVGGVLETAVLGLPAGLGAPWFDTVEGLLSHALFSIPAVKGVEFGDGFALAELRGSQANDPFRMENGRVVTESNHNGGINGGLTNGMPLIFRTAVKPTPSIAAPQRTLNLATGEETELRISGRHDPCIAPRARAVQDAVTAFVVLDLLETP
ncbi:MAG: chorismate synthase [Oscillospiraceae bacterium]|nr:chorismate synthase [Oscillospiraceae bacterium]